MPVKWHAPRRNNPLGDRPSMNLNLHKNSRTTPAIRQELRESPKSERELAHEYHLNRATVRQWWRRDTGADASHRPHRLHTTLTPAQELVVK